MTWTDFYLFCFGFGFLFSVVSVIMGHFHLDWADAGSGADASASDVGGVELDSCDAPDGPAAGTDSGSHPSVFSMGTISAFLAWFGGTGYLISTYYAVGFFVTAMASAAAGLVGAYIVFWFLSRVLMREREHLDPADYDMIGVLGIVSGAIRAEGTGEILFSQAGTRRAAPARSESGTVIPNGTEVVVTRYENGIAYVRRWEEFTASTATEV